ncbi:MAG: alpha/beta hydrolase [Bdellovibrionaceae bacterium]|nr:alpha/beta hydrolase [Bdellovibrio sp.]
MEINHWVLIRGLTRSRFHWLGFDSLLKNSLGCRQVTCIELPGNGYFFDQNFPLALDDLINQIKSQVDSASLPIGIIGLSMGGMIAARWAEIFPNEVQALVIINSSMAFSPFYHRLSPQFYFKLLLTLVCPSAEIIENTIMNISSNENLKWKNRIEELIQFQKNHAITFKNFLRQIKVTRQARIIKKPIEKVLILTSQKDRLVNYRCSLKLAELWKTPLKVHPSAGHDLPLDDSQWVIEQIKNFLRPS